ncbi:MAG: flagellar export chaperone FliS [Pseudomonadota bacterium]
MNMSAYKAASQSYASLDLETSINSASPHKLIVMLYEGAITSLLKAKALMEHKQIAQKGQEISRAISIIDEGLASCLNEEQGGDIAKNLAGLYEYMSRRLMQANLENNVEIIDEVIKLLSDLREAWEQIGTTLNPAQVAAATEEIALEALPANFNGGGTSSPEATTPVSYGKV